MDIINDSPIKENGAAVVLIWTVVRVCVFEYVYVCYDFRKSYDFIWHVFIISPTVLSIISGKGKAIGNISSEQILCCLLTLLDLLP